LQQSWVNREIEDWERECDSGPGWSADIGDCLTSVSLSLTPMLTPLTPGYLTLFLVKEAIKWVGGDGVQQTYKMPLDSPTLPPTQLDAVGALKVRCWVGTLDWFRSPAPTRSPTT